MSQNNNNSTNLNKASDLGFNSILSDPEDLCNGLEKRLDSWKKVVKIYITYFKETINVNQATNKNLDKALKLIDIPVDLQTGFKPENEVGIMQISNSIREFNKQQITEHEASSKDIDDIVLKQLITLKNEIKKKNKEFSSELHLLNAKINKHRGSIRTHYNALSKAFEEHDTHKTLTAEEDPWLINFSLNKQLQINNEEETNYMKTLRSRIASLENYEKSIVNTLKNILAQHYQFLKTCMNKEQENITLIADKVAQMNVDDEWKHFVNNNPVYSLDETYNTTKPIEDLQHNLQKDEFTKIVKEGSLQTQHGFGIFKTFKEHYFILTNTGFLHAFLDKEYNKHNLPLFSINIKACLLGPLNKDNLNFEITYKDSNKLFKNNESHLFKSNNSNEIEAWWSALSNKAASVLTLTNKSDHESKEPNSETKENVRDEKQVSEDKQ